MTKYLNFFKDVERTTCMALDNSKKIELKFTRRTDMRLIITVDIDIDESGLNEDEVKDNLVEFTKDLLIIGAEEQEIGLTLEEVSYSE